MGQMCEGRQPAGTGDVEQRKQRTVVLGAVTRQRIVKALKA
jgi:hypothetical protein